MSENDFERLLRRARAIPVVTIDDARQAAPLARALLAGGLNTVEITLRTKAARDAVLAIRHEVPEAVVGLGTVTAPAQLEDARDIGVHFTVSPGFDPELARTAGELGMPYLPGVTSPTEIMAAGAQGLKLLKFFPAEPAGGIPALKAFAGPFPDVSFCPTGGIGTANAPIYLAQPNVVCVGGAWLAPEADIAASNWDAITGRARAVAG